MTTYHVSATPHAPARPMHNRKAAITEADNRARYVKYAVTVTVTTAATGKIVHVVPAHTPDMEAIKEELNNACPTGDTEPPKPKPAGSTPRRPALGAAALPGWEVLYDKPRAGYQIWRSTVGTGYALWCIKHQHTHKVNTLKEEREARSAGQWCPACQDLPSISAEHTRKSIPTRLEEAGITWKQVSDNLGRMLYEIDGEAMTPGEAAKRHLS